MIENQMHDGSIFLAVMMCKTWIILSAIFFFPFWGFAQCFEQDRLLWNGEYRRLYTGVLRSRSDFETLNLKLNAKRSAAGRLLNCWKEDLEIVKGELYVNNVFYDSLKNDIKADLKDLFGAEYANGRVKATWFSDSLVLKEGKELIEAEFTEAIYERDIILTFNKGQLVKQRVGDNTKAYRSVYAHNFTSLLNFIYTRVNWKIIPFLKDKDFRVIVSMTSGEHKKPEDIRIERKVDLEILNIEALRIVKLLPEWDIFYHDGRLLRLGYHFGITFNEELRREYDK
ncbi:MAG: hypothetical protein ACOH2A_06055 [Sphingobacteriaceae bacterium]